MYKTSFKGEVIGYVENAKDVSANIDSYLDNGEGDKAAFVYIDEKPTYNLCLVKKDTQDSSENIIQTVKDAGTTYYETYMVKSKGEDKLYLDSEETAKNVIEQVESKNGEDTNLQYEVRYVENLENTDEKTAVDSLYVAKKVTKRKTSTASRSDSSSRSSNSTSTPAVSVSSGYYIQPIGGTYTQRYGSGHPGVDIAGPSGTDVVAAASGTVIYSSAMTNSSGRYVSYGECIKIQHDNGTVTLYAHLSSRGVSVGQYVSQGQVIGQRGSTGNSTGPHLHFEIRTGSGSLNPRSYF